MDLSQVQTVSWNLNPGLQGIAVTLKKYLFFNVEKISSTWKRCSVLLVSCLYTVLLARRYENGKDTSLSGDNRRILSSTCSLLLRPGLSVWDIVAMVNTMWLSSSNPWISIMDFSPGDSCRIKQKKKRRTVTSCTRGRRSRGKGKGNGIWVRDRAPLALLTRAEFSSPFLSNVRLGQRRHHWYPHEMTSEKKKTFNWASKY